MMQVKLRSVGLYALACIPAGLVLFQLSREMRTLRPAPLTPEQMLASVPRDVVAPATAAYTLEGAELRQFLAEPPIRIGARAPRISFVDFRRDPARIPAADHRPTVLAVSCGCVECASVLHELRKLSERVGDRAHFLGIVTTRSQYAWGHHGGTFGRTALQLLHDEDGSTWRRLRPPGNKPTRLPTVWACDGDGIVRFVGQPDPADPDADWVETVRRRLDLKPLPPKIRG